MARYLFLLLSFIVLSSTKCSQEKKSAPTEATAITTVYITTTGAKYHNGNCRSVKKSKVSISLPDAVAKGYQPCKLCHPPVADSTAQ
jgi:hypothetical protein